MEKFFFRNEPIRNKDCLWWPCLLTDHNKMCTLQRVPSIDASSQVSVHLADGFQRRRSKCEKLTDDRQQTTDAKSPQCLWQGELIKKISNKPCQCRNFDPEIKTGLQEKKPTTMHIVHLNKIILIFFFNKFLAKGGNIRIPTTATSVKNCIDISNNTNSFVNIYFHRLSETPVSSSHMAD